MYNGRDHEAGTQVDMDLMNISVHILCIKYLCYYIFHNHIHLVIL